MSEQLTTTLEAFEFPPEIAETLPSFDKSWMIRLGVLDVFAGSTRMIDFLETQTDIGDDLEALKRVSKQWLADEPIEVGESGTIYRIFKFASWMEQEQNPEAPERLFVKKGSLVGRNITDDPAIIHWGLDDLLTLDKKTSQWATAAVLLQDRLRPTGDIDFKLAVTFDAKSHWITRRSQGKPWEARADNTINTQAAAYLQALRGSLPDFVPTQAEDYCFARAYGLITPELGEELWPKLRYHESDRIESMETAIAQAVNGEIIDINDHRVVQAIAMRFGLSRNRFKYPDCVAKSWPKFWDFIEKSRTLTASETRVF